MKRLLLVVVSLFLSLMVVSTVVGVTLSVTGNPLRAVAQTDDQYKAMAAVLVIVLTAVLARAMFKSLAARRSLFPPRPSARPEPPSET
jgi:hypothetical protein